MKRLAALVVALFLVVAGASAPARGADPEPKTPIKHFIILYQENHTFDNYFGSRPGVDGYPPGTCVPLVAGTTQPCQKPFHVEDEGISDLGHSEVQFQRQFNNGKMDGFIEANATRGGDGSQTVAYYDRTDLPYYWNIADQYVLYDKFFSAARGGSLVNHMFAVTARAGLHGTRERIPAKGWGRLPTIFDRLQAAGVSWKFYIANYDPTITYRTRATASIDRASQVIWAPLLGYARFIDNPALSRHIVDLEQYYTDAASGTLPAVSYIVPSGDSEHPPGRVQAGERLVQALIGELMRSPEWDSSVFMWAYDDWGGWYDHVKPPTVDKWGYGFRVPALMVSPYAKHGYVDNHTADATSPLAFIEYNWGLKPLAYRDRHAYNLLDSFDFTAPPRPPELVSPLVHPPTPPAPVEPLPLRLLYGGALGLCALLVGGGLLRDRLRTRRQLRGVVA